MMITSSSSIIKKLFLLFLLIAGLYYGKDFLMPISIGTVLATLFLPLCKWMEKKRVPRGIAAFLCLLLFFVVVIGIIAMLSWQIAALANDYVLIKEKSINAANRAQLYIINHFGISAFDQNLLLKNDQHSVSSMLQTLAGSFISFLTSFILTSVYLVLLLYYRLHIKSFILRLFDQSQQKEMETVVSNAARVSQQYLLGLAKMIVCLWVMYGIGFTLLGVENPIFYAVLCGLLEIVPFIGNITGTTLTVLVSIVHGAEMPTILGIICVYGVVQFIQGWVLEPLILGPQVKINPLFTVIALLLGELLWGIPGVILAIPLTAMLKIVCDHIESLKPYGFLIGEIEKKKTMPSIVQKLKNWKNQT